MFKKPILSASGKQWLKTLHLILSMIWLGGAVCMHTLRLAWTPSTSADLYAVNHAIVVLDHWIMIPASLSALLTGFLESWLTSWGFFKFRWVLLKWIITAAIMLYGPFFQAQWAKSLEELSKVQGLLALQDPIYLHYRFLYTFSGIVMITAITIMPILSVIKPWMRGDKLRLNSKKAVTAQIGASMNES